ncbi:MAG: hypothetical protein M3348_07215, partial [Acidobacteriota bacterium]|nr:hypothetical protein [Acidobacteriota bacterium]
MEEKPSQAATHLTPDPLEASQTRARRGERRAGKAARALALDLTPLRASRDFRLLFFAQAVTFFGSMTTFIVLPWQMYR